MRLCIYFASFSTSSLSTSLQTKTIEAKGYLLVDIKVSSHRTRRTLHAFYTVQQQPTRTILNNKIKKTPKDANSKEKQVWIEYARIFP